MPASRTLPGLAFAFSFAVAVACGGAHGATLLSGNTIASGRLRDDVVAEVTAQARQRAQCASIDSIVVTDQRVAPGARTGSDGSLVIGSATERWEARLCGAAVRFTVTITGNGMLGPKFWVEKD